MSRARPSGISTKAEGSWVDTSALPDPWYQKIRPIACDGVIWAVRQDSEGHDRGLREAVEERTRRPRTCKECAPASNATSPQRGTKGSAQSAARSSRRRPSCGCGATRGRPLRRMRSEAPALGNEGGAAAQEGREDPSTNVDRICGFRIEPLRDGHLEFTELEEKHFFVARLENDLQGSENRRGGVQRCPRGDSCSLPRRHGARLRERDRLARRVLGIDDEPRRGFDYVKRVPKK